MEDSLEEYIRWTFAHRSSGFLPLAIQQPFTPGLAGCPQKSRHCCKPRQMSLERAKIPKSKSKPKSKSLLIDSSKHPSKRNSEADDADRIPENSIQAEDEQEDPKSKPSSKSKKQKRKLAHVDINQSQDEHAQRDVQDEPEIGFSNNDSSEKSDLKLYCTGLSHKEQRKRRKLEKKLQSEPTNTSPLKEQPSGTSTNAKITKNSSNLNNLNTPTQYGVWVGNLSFKTSPQDLVGFFGSCGKISRLNMPAGKGDQDFNKGFAYVDFETESACEDAIKKSELHLGGRKLLIKRSSDFSGRPTPSGAQNSDPQSASVGESISKTARRVLDRQKQAPAPCLFLGNLAFETTVESIINAFEAHHRASLKWKPKSAKAANASTSKQSTSEGAGIRKVRMGTFEDSAECKGFAFVDFFNVQQATEALLNIKNHTLNGRKLVVEYASPDAVRRGGGTIKSIPRKSISSNQVGNSEDKNVKSSRPKLNNQCETESTFQHQPIPTELKSDQGLDEKSESIEAMPEKKASKTGFKGRLKPGAALANARRAPIGIIKNPQIKNTKILF
ncbi:hypothetical protein O181_028005 [Austropuccinia psidii MF-1]|uniref:RRM domain-containing protein n=1 Tax=Austropuccinia psidii MF-1 TaxID=1389203 RepID=A0A9Q3H3R8_9BASI|nr:hypothetical protein [Austropuccinia psidii MF-1]